MLDVVSRFESLGNNCEFGFVQRSCGHEDGGLFRWTFIDGVDTIIDALVARFEGLYDFTNLTPAGGGTMVADSKFKIAFHSRMSGSEVDGKWVFNHSEAERRYQI